MYSNMDSAGETISVLDELLKQNLLSCIQIQLNTEINNNYNYYYYYYFKYYF